MIPEPAQAQLHRLVEGLTAILGQTLRGVYLHGSAALCCFGPHSDVDVVAVVDRPTTDDEQRALAALCLEFSGGAASFDFDVLVRPALRPWVHPATLEFHYDEVFREKFEAGELRPWRVETSKDIAALLTIVHHSGKVLAGSPPADTLPMPPVADYREAILYEAEWCRKHVDDQPRYVVLSLARVWATLATGEVHSKASGAEWALDRLPAEPAGPLRHALAVYRGAAVERSWGEFALGGYVKHVLDEIGRVA